MTFARRSGPAVSPRDKPPIWEVVVAWDAVRRRWTASVESWGASGTGPTPGAAVDDLFRAIPDLIATADALQVAGGMTVEWAVRRDALIAAKAALKGAEGGTNVNQA